MESDADPLFTPAFPARFFLERCDGVLRRPTTDGPRVAVLATEVLNGGMWRVAFEPDLEQLRGLPAPEALFVPCSSAHAAALCMLLGPRHKRHRQTRPQGWSVRVAVSGDRVVPLSIVPP